MPSWILFAILSALFAALVTVLAKIGLRGVDPNLATAIRTLVILALTWGIVFATGGHKGIAGIDKKALAFLILSGLATGASWLFYFHALRRGPTASVAAIDKLSLAFVFIIAVTLLGETFTWKTAISVALVAAGCIVMAL